MTKFKKTNRLLGRRDFQFAFDQGQKIVSRDMVVVHRIRQDADPKAEPRLGLVITRKIGNAVVRNQFKRHIREIFRRLLPRLIEEGWHDVDFVVIARHSADGSSQLQLQRSFEWCLRKAIEVGQRSHLTKGAS